MKWGHVFEIKEASDLTELVKNTLITNRTEEYISSTINLKDRNVYLIYIILPGSGRDYCLKELLSTPSEIKVKVVELTFPGVGGACDMNAKAFILSSPKNYVKGQVTVAFDKMNMYLEPEFDGFVDLEAVDEALNRDISLLDLPLFQKAKALHMPLSDLEKEFWFLNLDLEQKNIILKSREGVALRNKKLEGLGEEKIEENKKDRRQRFYQLKSRLQEPRCG